MIILTNDDGANSPALTTTLNALSDKKILPVVPSRDVSGCSMCITIDRPISVEKIMINKHEVFTCDGKTADCVLLAKTIAKEPIAALISGINTGPNLGVDVLYSGTIAGARKGTLLNIPSVAISIEKNYKKQETMHYESAGLILGLIKDLIINNPPPKRHFVNVNIPNQPIKKIRGALSTILGRRGYVDRMKKINNQTGKMSFVCEDEEVREDFTPQTDSWAISEKFISLTLLKDMINDSVSNWSLDPWIQAINTFLEGRNEKI